MKFVIKKSADNKPYVVIVADNSEVLYTSETYEDSRSAIHVAKLVKAGAAAAAIETEDGVAVHDSSCPNADKPTCY